MQKQKYNRSQMPYFYNANTERERIARINSKNRQTRKYSSRVVNPLTRQRILSVLHSNESTHSKVLSGISPASFNQDTLYSVNLTGNISQGTSNSARVGDKIYLDKIEFRAVLDSLNAINTSRMRIVLLYSTEEFQGSSDAFGSSQFSPSELFLNTATSNWCNFGIFDPKKCTVIYDRTVEAVPTFGVVAAASRDTTLLTGTVNLKKNHIYQSGLAFGKFSSLYLLVGFDTAGVASGAATGTYMYWNSNLTFKNSM